MSDGDSSDLSFSPEKPFAHPERPKTPKTPTGPPPRNDPLFSSNDPATRDEALERELHGVRNINELLEGVIGTLERAKGNMGTVSQTVNTASTLLNTWTKILSQTEHNQKLILNPDWKGASEDLLAIENEERLRQAAVERRAMEEERRRTDTERKRADEERRRETAAATPTRGAVRASRSVRGVRGTRASTRASTSSSLTRGSGVTGVRGTRGGVSGYGTRKTESTEDGPNSFTSARSTSGIGRGIGGTRGRARGSRGT